MKNEQTLLIFEVVSLVSSANLELSVTANDASANNFVVKHSS